MVKEIKRFGNIETENILIEDLDIEKIQVSSMVFSAEKNHKYFISYKDDDHKIKSYIMLPKRAAYVKSNDGETKWMNFFIKDDHC